MGLTLAPGAGAMLWDKMGFTALFTALMPLWIWGAAASRISGGRVSALGIRLRALSREKGHTRRRATRAHSRQKTHLGTFRNTRRSTCTASTSHPAEILRLTSFRKTASMLRLLISQ